MGWKKPQQQSPSPNVEYAHPPATTTSPIPPPYNPNTPSYTPGPPPYAPGYTPDQPYVPTAPTSEIPMNSEGGTAYPMDPIASLLGRLDMVRYEMILKDHQITMDILQVNLLMDDFVT